MPDQIKQNLELVNYKYSKYCVISSIAISSIAISIYVTFYRSYLFPDNFLTYSMHLFFLLLSYLFLVLALERQRNGISGYNAFFCLGFISLHLVPALLSPEIWIAQELGSILYGIIIYSSLYICLTNKKYVYTEGTIAIILVLLILLLHRYLLNENLISNYLIRQYLSYTQGIQALFITINLLIISIKQPAVRSVYQQLITKFEQTNTNLASSELLISTASHELRNPLNIISFTADELKIKLAKLLSNSADDQTDMLNEINTIRNETDQMLTIVNDILLFNSLKNTSYPLKIQTLYMPNIRNSFTKRNNKFISSKNLIFSLDFDEDMPEYLLFDLNKVKQIVDNIIANAIKFSPKGGTIKFSGAYDFDKQEVVFKVSDEGFGINTDQDSHLAPYSGLQRGFRKNYQGFGLGLSISSKLAELIGGSLVFINNVKTGGRGTTAILRFHALITDATTLDEEKEENREENESPIAESFEGLKVLCIDDNEINLKILAILLEKLGINAQTTISADEAMKLIEEDNFDLCITDITMPNISGEDLCEFIKLKKPQLIVFAYTGNVMPSQIDYFRTIGFAEIIEKPITLPSLKLKLARHFNLKALCEMELLT